MVRPDLHLPPSFLAWLSPFLAAFSRRTRSTTAALATGALLAVGPRTLTNCLRALGLAEYPSANPPGFAGFTAFHRVLNRNAWSGLALARTLLHRVVATFVPSGPIIIGLDHTLERRRGLHIGPAGRFYDASHRADMPKPTSRGLRWLSAMVLVEVPFAGRIWELPADCPDPEQSVVRAPRTAPPHRDRVGPPAAAHPAALAAEARDRRRDGRRVRRTRTAACAAPVDGGHHADAEG